MDAQIVTLGNPTTLSVDYQNGEANIYFEKNTADIHTLFEREFRNYNYITVLLSGGIDSQFSACLAKKYVGNMHALCFRFVWEGRVINATDIVNAQEFAKLHDIELILEDFDLSYHYENEQIEYLTHYRVYSPQLSTYIAAIKNSPNIKGAVMMGGEIPIVYYDSDGVWMGKKIYEIDGKQTTVGLDPRSLFISHYAPFVFLDLLNGIQVIRDPFMMTPEIMYAAYMQNAEVIKNTGTAHFSNRDQSLDSLQFNAQKYKANYYSSFGFDLLPPLNKRTGFEALRFHLASVTGNYDEYERRYRLPIKRAMKTMPWVSPKVFTVEDQTSYTNGIVKNVFHGSEGIEQAIMDIIADVDVKPSNYYNLDW